jgi:glycosyltransferase involved in cell wall biosynthesis
MKPELSVVVPICGYDSIGSFMATLQVAWGSTIEVIILDSSKFGERQDSVNYDTSGKSTVIRAIIDPPIPYYVALNMGARMARGEYIAICHDDVLFGYKSLHHCVEAMNHHDLPCAFPRHTYGPASVESFEVYGKDAAARPLRLISKPETDYLPCCMVYTWDIFELLGWFDEQFTFFEGIRDYWYRLIEHGYPPCCVDNALVHHFEGRTRNLIKGKDFDAIEKADKKAFKAKWGKLNSKALLRQLKSDDGGGPPFKDIRKTR